MWYNNSGFLGGDNVKGFDFDNARVFDNSKGFDNKGFDNFSGFQDSATFKPFGDGRSHNRDHLFHCHQSFTGSRLEAYLRGEPWEGHSRRR